MAEKELLFSVTKKDLDITWFSGTGNGGQYRNKHQNCCRIVHRDSGAMGTGQSQRGRQSNLKEALTNLTENPKFKDWIKVRTAEVTGEKAYIEDLVDTAMKSSNLKVECQQEGKWVNYNENNDSIV